MKEFFKYFFATILGIIVLNLLFGIIIFAVVASISGSHDEVKIKPSSVLHLRFDYPVEERTSDNPFEHISFSDFKPNQNLGLNDILRNLRKASADANIKGIYLDLSGISMGAGTLEEIREALLKFRESGKFIVAYCDDYSQGAYYLATAASKIYINPQGSVEFKGISAQVMFLKGTLEKLGIEPQVIRHGKFKSAVEPFILDKMSDANKEQTMTYLGSIWNHVVQGISKTRNISPDSLKMFADSLAIEDASLAVKHHFADGVKYYDEILTLLDSMAGSGKNGKPNLVALKDYKDVAVTTKSTVQKTKIAVIYATGDIIMGEGDDGSIGSDGLSKTIRKAREDSTVKGVILRVNSPGGSALASEVIWREVSLTRKVKPVIISMGDVAASGGYYISCPADVIVANPTTLTGSIGVFGLMMNVQKLMNDKLGITMDGIKTNANSDIGTVTRPMSEYEKKVIQRSVENIYKVFTTHVSAGRNMPVDRVDSLGQGRVWSGENAKNIGLVDELGGMEKALEIMKKKLKAKELRVVELPEELPFVQELIKEIGANTRASSIENTLGLAYPYYKSMKAMLRMQGVQARLPFDLFLN